MIWSSLKKSLSGRTNHAYPVVTQNGLFPGAEQPSHLLSDRQEKLPITLSNEFGLIYRLLGGFYIDLDSDADCLSVLECAKI